MDLKDVLDGLTAARHTNYLSVAGYTLAIADYLHTLPDEIRFMWGNPLNLPLILFFFVRYAVFAHIALHAAGALLPAISPDLCRIGILRSGISTIVLIAGSEAILFVRVYAFTGRTKPMLSFLSLQAIGGLTAAIVLLTKYLRSVQYETSPIAGAVCIPARAHGMLAGGAFAALLANAIVVMLVMVYTAFLKHKKNHSCLFKIFWRDGVVYFILLSIFASINIIVNFTASQHYTFLFIQPEVFIHVILSTRMLLHLRGWASNEVVAANASSGRAIPMGGMAWSDPYGAKDPLTAIRFDAIGESQATVSITSSMGQTTKVSHASSRV